MPGVNAMTTITEEFFNFLFTRIDMGISGPKNEGHL